MKAIGLLAACLLIALPALAQDESKVLLPAGARVGIVNLVDTDVTHFHSGKAVTDSFMRTYRPGWSSEEQVETPLRERLASLGATPVPLQPTPALRRNAEEWFITSTRGNRLARACHRELERLATAERLDAIIVAAPGNNASPEPTDGNRLRQMPAHIRGWGISTTDDANARPVIFNLVQFLLVEVTDDGAQLRHREWGGQYLYEWTTFEPPADLRALPDAELQKLRPLLDDVIARQITRFTERLAVAAS